MTAERSVSSILVACGSKSAAEKHYLPAVRVGGWTGPVVLVAAEDPLPELEAFSALLVTGGLDIHPDRWDPSEPLHPTAEPAPERDTREVPLIQAAWARRMPILGICRGEQVLNVALGGSMIQHVPDHYGCPVERHQLGRADDGPRLAHGVTLAPGSRLAGLLGCTEVQVNTRHHQAVRRVAPGLRAVAWHLDTVHPETGPLVEAVEAEDPGRWVVGVQWHPENLVGLGGEPGAAARRLFEAFAQAARSGDTRP